MDDTQFKDEAILLVAYETEFELTNDGIEFLNLLKDNKICIVSIIGPKKTGKSSLGNMLIETENGFPMNETKGLWVWGRPLVLPDHSLLLIIDAEGLQLTEAAMKYDFSLFSLCLLISSIVIYNTTESSENCLKTFNTFTEKFKQTLLGEDEPITSRDISEIIFAFRSDQTETMLNSKEEMISLIKNSDVPSEDFLSLFQKRKVFEFPKTITNTLPNESIENLTLLKENIRNHVLPKKIENIYLNGNFMFGLLQSYADCLNLDEVICVKNSLESVLLSNIADHTEKLKSDDIETLETYLQSPKRSNINDLIKFYFESLIMKEVEELCTNGVGEFLTAKQIHSYIANIMQENIESYDNNFNTFKNDYEDMIKQCQSNPFLSSSHELSLNEIKSYFNSFASYVKENINSIIAYPPFSFTTQTTKLINANIVEPLSSIGSILEIKINEILGETSLLTSKLEQSQNEKAKYIKIKQEEILKLKYQVETLDRNLKEKELEYMSKLNIEKDKYVQLKENLTKTINEKDDIIKDLEEQIEIKMNENDKSITDNNSNKESSNFKSLFNKVTNVLVEYKLAVDKLSEPNIFTKNLIIDKSIIEFENKYASLYDSISNQSVIQEIRNNYQKELIQVKEENYSLKENLAKEKILFEEMKENVNKLKKDVEEKIDIIEAKNRMIQNLHQSQVFYEKTIKDNELEISVRENELYTCNDELEKKDNNIDDLLYLFKEILSKRKDQYDNFISKLPKTIQNTLNKYITDYHVF